MKFHRTSLTKNYKILDETFVQTISSLYIYIYIYIDKHNKFENVCLFFPFRLMISIFSLFFFWFYRYRHRCSTLIDPPYPLHPATRFERFAARYVKRERVFSL